MARDLVHSYAALFVCVDVEQRRQVPRYRLALAVGVGGEQRSGANRRSSLERLYEVGLAAHLYVLGLEAVFDVYRHTPFRKVAHVADAREHAVFRAEYLFERLGLRGGLDYNERLSLVLCKFLKLRGRFRRGLFSRSFFRRAFLRRLFGGAPGRALFRRRLFFSGCLLLRSGALRSFLRGSFLRRACFCFAGRRRFLRGFFSDGHRSHTSLL